MDELLERVLLQAEVLELKAPAQAPARGFVIAYWFSRGTWKLSAAAADSGSARASASRMGSGFIG